VVRVRVVEFWPGEALHAWSSRYHYMAWENGMRKMMGGIRGGVSDRPGSIVM